MGWLTRSKIVVAGCAVVAAAACGSSNKSRTATGEATGSIDRDRDAPKSETAASSITVAGCLQQGNGSDFILTRINEPSESVGTAGTKDAAAARSGSSGAGVGTVERERLRSAAGAYRVEAADGVNLADLVGREVRVVGTIKQNMDLPRANAQRDPVQVKEGDLARIEPASVSQTAAQCRGAETPATGTRSGSTSTP
jgi:hypothetical protein